jgi:hypothetical protein
VAKSSRSPTARKVREERRAHRHRFVQFLWFHRLDAPGGGLARSIDVSEEGVGFIANQEVSLSERIFVVLLTPFGRVSTIARVMHCSAAGDGSFRIGARIEVLPPTDKAAWTTLVEKEAP